MLYHAHYLPYNSMQCSTLCFAVRAAHLMDRRVIGRRGAQSRILIPCFTAGLAYVAKHYNIL
jgi:hypothetical protein